MAGVQHGCRGDAVVVGGDRAGVDLCSMGFQRSHATLAAMRVVVCACGLVVRANARALSIQWGYGGPST